MASQAGVRRNAAQVDLRVAMWIYGRKDLAVGFQGEDSPLTNQTAEEAQLRGVNIDLSKSLVCQQNEAVREREPEVHNFWNTDHRDIKKNNLRFGWLWVSMVSHGLEGW